MNLRWKRRYVCTGTGLFVALTVLRDPSAFAADGEEPAALEGAPGSEMAEPDPAAPAPDASPLEWQSFELINSARAARNIHPLAWDADIATVARAHARDMMLRGVVSHRGSDGSSPVQRLRRAGIVFQFGSENIWTFYGSPPEAGPVAMHAAMMAEPHRPGLWNHIANILYPGYRRTGIGLVVAPAGVQYLVQNFCD